MKISPVAQGSGLPAGSAATDRMPADRLSAAKKIASGQVVEETTGNPGTTDRQVERISARRIKMKTNASPEQYIPPTDPAAQSVTPDATEQVAEVTEDTKPLSPQFAALAKQKRALQTERAAFDAEKLAFEAQKNGPNPDSEIMANLKSNPLKTLLDAGVTYEQLTEQILAEQSNPDIQALRQEIKTLKDGFESKLSDRDTQAEKQVLAEMEREADGLIAQGDEFELVRETGSKDQAMELIKRTYKTTGEILDVSEALGLIENELITESLKLANLKKVQTKLTPTAPMQTQMAPSKQMRTLTSRDGSSVPLSAKQRAIAAFHGQLRK